MTHDRLYDQKMHRLSTTLAGTEVACMDLGSVLISKYNIPHPQVLKPAYKVRAKLAPIFLSLQTETD
mgnify:CR=1 FL=1